MPTPHEELPKTGYGKRQVDVDPVTPQEAAALSRGTQAPDEDEDHAERARELVREATAEPWHGESA